MRTLKEISESLTLTLKEGELQSVSIDLIETIGDSLLKDGVLKDLPILGMFFGLSKGVMNVRDLLFAKKLLSFLSESSSVSKEERLKQIEKIEQSNDYQIKVGEKLLYLVETCEDHAKAKIIGKLFRALLIEKINYNEFLKCSNAVQNLIVSDIIGFLNYKSEDLVIEMASQYISAGLMNIIYLPPRMVDNSRIPWQKLGSRIDLEPGKTYARISPIGVALKMALEEI